MIAYFGNKQHLCSPTKRRKGAGTFALAPEDEASIYATFDVLAEELPRRHRAELDEHLIPTGNGIAYAVSCMERYSQHGSASEAYFLVPADSASFSGSWKAWSRALQTQARL